MSRGRGPRTGRPPPEGANVGYPLGKPRLVLADEPTGNLDQENARQVLTLLRTQVKQHGAAGILVTHSEAAAATTDRTYRLRPDGLTLV